MKKRILGITLKGASVLFALCVLINIGSIQYRDYSNPCAPIFRYELRQNGESYVLTHIPRKSSLYQEQLEGIYCVVLPSRYEGKWVTSVAKYAAYEEWQIMELEIPRNYERLEELSFAYCQNLQEVHFAPHSKLEYIGGAAFKQCGFLTFTIPDSVKFTGTGVFSECHDLKTVKIGRNLVALNEVVFLNCYALEEVKFSTFGNLKVIDRGAFLFTRSLQSIDLPSSLTAIRQEAFRGSGLTSITIPKGVREMGKGVFMECENLTDIYCEAKSMPEGWDPDWLEGCNATVHWNA